MTRPQILGLVGAVVLLLAGASIAFAGYRAQRPTPPPPPDSRPVLPVRKAGINLVADRRDAYDGETVRASVRQAREAGAFWVVLLPTWYQSDGRACDLRPDPARTVSDAGTYALIQDLKRSGLRVALAPQVAVADGSANSAIDPLDPVCWFSAYDVLIDHYAQLATVGGADLFVLGTELTALTIPRHAIQWRELATRVRRQFAGPLTYAAAWGVDQRAEYRQIDWWDAVDFIGVDAFFPVQPPGTEQADFAAAWRSFPLGRRTANWVEDVHQVSRKYNRFVILTRLGYRSETGAAEAPANARVTGTPAPDLQAALVAAAREAWQREFWLEGVFIWAWQPDQTAGGLADTGYTPQGKPALAQWRRWFTQQQR